MANTATTHQTKWWSGGKSPFNLEYGKLMMWYFLMSDAFTFGAFLISYGSTCLFSFCGECDAERSKKPELTLNKLITKHGTTSCSWTKMVGGR